VLQTSRPTPTPTRKAQRWWANQQDSYASAYCGLHDGGRTHLRDLTIRERRGFLYVCGARDSRCGSCPFTRWRRGAPRRGHCEPQAPVAAWRDAAAVRTNPRGCDCVCSYRCRPLNFIHSFIQTVMHGSYIARGRAGYPKVAACVRNSKRFGFWARMLLARSACLGERGTPTYSGVCLHN